MVKFISYNGSYPNLCSGTLVIEVDGKEYEMNYILCSGGSVWFDDGWCEHVESGEWSIREDELPEEIRKYKNEIEDLVNANVSWGCCGGCV